MPAEKHGSSGLPSIFAEVIIADESGEPVTQGQVGELLVRGPVVTPGYRNRAEANQAAFTRSGWFRTGDAACRDEDGYFYIVDRWKDMFISGGENIYPAEVERVLGLLTDVAECAVAPMGDGKWGEVGRAFIVRTKSSLIGPDELRAHCEAHLARYKIPKEFVFTNELPRNSTARFSRRSCATRSGPKRQMPRGRKPEERCHDACHLQPRRCGRHDRDVPTAGKQLRNLVHRDLDAAIEAAERDVDCRVVTVRSNLPDFFSGGADIKQFRANAPHQNMEMITLAHDTLSKPARSDKIYSPRSPVMRSAAASKLPWHVTCGSRRGGSFASGCRR